MNAFIPYRPYATKAIVTVELLLLACEVGLKIGYLIEFVPGSKFAIKAQSPPQPLTVVEFRASVDCESDVNEVELDDENAGGSRHQ